MESLLKHNFIQNVLAIIVIIIVGDFPQAVSQSFSQPKSGEIRYYIFDEYYLDPNSEIDLCYGDSCIVGLQVDSIINDSLIMFGEVLKGNDWDMVCPGSSIFGTNIIYGNDSVLFEFYPFNK